MIKYILASGSPRRKELLDQIGLAFTVLVAHGEEVITKETPWEIVEELSYIKANAVTTEKAAAIATAFAETVEAEKTGDRANNRIVIIGADTIVAYGNEIMGKPKDREDAVRMLTLLQNNTHQVYTGVTLVILDNGEKKTISFYEKTDVTMYPMTTEQIAAYVSTGEPMDKAGAYAIQGKCAAYIKGINGDYNNVVGLPVARFIHELIELQFPCV